MNSYDIGNQIKLRGAFVVDGVPTDPGTITVRVKTPSGVVSTFVYGTDVAVVRESVGVYRLNWSTTEHGVHQYRFSGTTPAPGAREGAFNVRRSEF